MAVLLNGTHSAISGNGSRLKMGTMCLVLTETRNVQDPNVVVGAFEREALVDSTHNPVKHAEIQCLRESISSIGRLLLLEGNTE